MASPSVDPASASRADESDLDPAAFLKSVRELSEKREREDAERYRKLEEEIERSKQERAARRADRARSISPQKAASRTPSTLKSSPHVNTTTSPTPMTPPPPSSTTMDGSANESTTTPTSDVPEFKGFGATNKSKPSIPATQSPAIVSDTSESASKPSPSASSLARSGSLIWQQRPSSRGANSRPKSMLASGSSSPTRSTTVEELEPSRDQIAASLAARDPNWFKQTADRGIGNAAYRKTQDENTSSDSFVSGRRGLPGMSRPQVAESSSPANFKTSANAKPEILPQTNPASDSFAPKSAFSTERTSTTSKPDLKSLIAEDEGQANASPMAEQTTPPSTNGNSSNLSRAPTISSSQARVANAPERPSSPTKGMGGFVQSAMLKRSDSVTKRWSAQPGPSLSRADSISSSRGGYGGLTGSHSMPRMEPTSSNAEANERPASKLSASNSNLADLSTTNAVDSNPSVKPSLPSYGRSQSMASNHNPTTEDGYTSPPSSPSKRWSPAKSTWLESAIAKPEPPKPSAARNSQPSWMADIAKAKAQKASVDATQKSAESRSRSASPIKEVFGQSILKQSGSRDLGKPSPLPSKAPEQEIARSPSPSKSVRAQDFVQRPRSQTLGRASPAIEPVVEVESNEVPLKKAVEPTEQNRTGSEEQSSVPAASKTKPLTPPKPQTDFRSNLRPRSQAETKQEEKPEFLSRFGTLRKTQTQNYVAPDVLKDNITRGKSELVKTGGPVKSERKDEFKESLVAKKELWKKEKNEGIVHERKVSGPPATPQKPEALAKRELLGRSESTKAPSIAEKPKTATPEALARHKTLKEKPQINDPLPELGKQTSASTGTTTSMPTVSTKSQTSTPMAPVLQQSTNISETSVLAARFNPGLAGIIARGPQSTANGSEAASRSESPIVLERSSTARMSAPTEPQSEGGQLQDMRKGRAKGPKKRKGGLKESETDADAPSPTDAAITAPTVRTGGPSAEKVEPNVEQVRSEPVLKQKPQALPGSAASIMLSSLNKPSAAPGKPAESVLNKPVVASSTPSTSGPPTPVRSSFLTKEKAVEANGPFSARTPPVSTAKAGNERPPAPAKSPALLSRVEPAADKTAATPDTFQKPSVPESRGFGSTKQLSPASRFDDDKENIEKGSPSVKSAASQWGKQPPAERAQPPAQINLPSKKDEEAALKAAGLLSSSPTRPGSSNGLGISIAKTSGVVETPPPFAGAPPKPVKSSRAVSGQLPEPSPSKADPARMLSDAFGTLPTSSGPLSIDTPAVIASSPHQERVFKTVQKSIQVVAPHGSPRQLARPEEYTFFDEFVYVFTHVYTVADGPKKSEIFIWSGDSSSRAVVEQAESTAKRLAKDAGSASVHAVSQGLEPAGFLQALGGILITRRGSQPSASKRYMLRGRKHLGQIVFDEVDFRVDALCSGFAYLISYPASNQEARLYLWKGSACSFEETSAARLAAADLGDNSEVIEVDDGAEFASFLKIFGNGTAKSSIPRPHEIWRKKPQAPETFAARLFKIEPAEAKGGVLSSIFTRRPSWGNLSPARRGESQTKLVAKELSPFTQSDLEADCVYFLDAHSVTYVLVGPMLSTQAESVRNLLFGQTLLFAADYAVLAVSTDDRPSMPKGFVLLSGVPAELKLLFRHWDDSIGLWDGAGLMDGSQSPGQNELKMLDLNEAIGLVCKP